MLYIDATSGGMALQIILSGFVGGIVFIKLFWRNLTSSIFHRGSPAKAEADPAEAKAEPTQYTTDSTAS